MTSRSSQKELRGKTQRLLHGALKHVRVAALAAALVPVGTLAVSPALAQDCGSGGCPVTETPTETDTDTPTETPTLTPTETPADTATPTQPQPDTPTPPPTDTPTVKPSETATSAPSDTPTPMPTDTPSDTATSAPSDTPTPMPTDTPSDTATPTPPPSDTSTPLPTDTATMSPTRTPTVTQTLTKTPTATPTPTSTPLPTCGCPTAPGFPNSGAAGQYAVFALNTTGGNQKAKFSNVTVNGDVAIASGAKLDLAAPSTINGNLFMDAGGSWSGGPGRVNGLVFTNQDLAAARTAALNASAQAAALTPNFTFTNVTSNQTVTGISGVNVIRITGNINLSSKSLTLTGPPDAFFVVNLAGSLKLDGTGGIVVSGGALANQVLVNMTGTGSLISTHVGNIINAVVLAPNVGGTIHSANGSFLLGRDFTLMSDADVNFRGCCTADAQCGSTQTCVAVANQCYGQCQ